MKSRTGSSFNPDIHGKHSTPIMLLSDSTNGFVHEATQQISNKNIQDLDIFSQQNTLALNVASQTNEESMLQQKSVKSGQTTDFPKFNSKDKDEFNGAITILNNNDQKSKSEMNIQTPDGEQIDGATEREIDDLNLNMQIDHNTQNDSSSNQRHQQPVDRYRNNSTTLSG